MKKESIDELERTCTYNLHEKQRVLERGDEPESSLVKTFEQRMNTALEGLGDYFRMASGVVAEITNES